jgi:zinc finger RNA-binding protein
VNSKKEVESASVPELQRQLKGVMRVGSLAKGLLLHGDLDLQLVVLCQNKPTTTLLHLLYEILPKQFDVSFN